LAGLFAQSVKVQFLVEGLNTELAFLLKNTS